MHAASATRPANAAIGGGNENESVPANAHASVNELATVIANLGDNTFLTQAGEQGRACRRAASCLLLPEVGDTVLLASAGGAHYLLAVIERAASTPAQLQVEGDLVVSSADGSVGIHAATDLRLSARSLAVDAQEGQVSVDRMRLVGTLWQGAMGTVRLVAKACESIADRIVQHATTSVRTIDQVERVRAGQIDMQAENLVRIQGRCVMAKATDVYKVDAKLMHMG